MARGAVAKFGMAVATLALLGACSVVPDRIRDRSDRDARPTAERPIERSGLPSAPQPTISGELCHARLTETQAKFSPLPDRYYDAGCSNIGTIRLLGLRGDASDFEVSNLGAVSCPLAEKFAAWARFGVDRAARQILGASLVRIETMGSYSCRNVAGSSRRSAHATAEAIDVSAFILSDGRRISLSGNWTNGSADERRFLRIVHQSACKRLGTVLGPDYNAAHHDHFHLELGGGRFCR